MPRERPEGSMNKTSLRDEPVNGASKPNHKRGSLSRRSRSEATKEVRDEVHERSGRACERCDRARATQLAHIERRWKSEGKPTKEEFVDLCVPCHKWADSCDEGRAWLIDFQSNLLREGA